MKISLAPFCKVSLLISILLFCNSSLFAEKIYAAENRTNQYSKTLINEWVKFKLINLALEEKGAKTQEELIQLFSDKNTNAKDRIHTRLKSIIDEFNAEIKLLNPQTVEIKKLVDLYTKNNEISLKVMPNHFQLEQTAEENSLESNRHHQEFMRFADATAAAVQYESEIEIQVLQYLKDHPLK